MENNNEENNVGTPVNQEPTKSVVNNNSIPPKKKLGVTKETQSSSGLPIPAPYRAERSNQFPNKYVFPIAKLVKVHYDPAKETKTGLTPALTFVFVALGTPKKQFTHVEFPIDDTDVKFEAKAEWMNSRLKHFFDETVGANKFVEGSMSGDTFEELFENVANAFNSLTYKSIPLGGSEEDAKVLPLFTKTQIYIKLTYNKSRLQFGLFPNLLQRASTNGTDYLSCELLIDSKYDNVEPQVQASINAGGNSIGARDNSFGGSVDDTDFPDV